MKTIILISAIFFSVIGFAQTQKQKDSIVTEQAKINKAIGEIVTKTSIQEFQTWLYENVPAKTYNEFIPLYNTFIEKKYQQQSSKK